VNKLGYKIYSPYICNEFNQNGKAIIRIEEEIKALRIEIQSVWEITLIQYYQYYVQSYLD
jgi:hypothetical protein